MQAGKLRHRLAIEKLTTEVQDDGSAPKVWTEIAEVSASVRPLRGTELYEADQMKATGDHKVTMRYYAGLRPQEHRFKLGDRVLNIVSVANRDERNISQECLCREEP